MKPSDFFVPAMVLVIVMLIVAAVVFWRLRKFVFKQPEDTDKEAIRRTRVARAEFVQSRQVEKGVQDHRYFDRSLKANRDPEETEQFRGHNNMFFHDDDPLASARGSQAETALALIFGFCSINGTSETQKEAAKVREIFTKHGYKVVTFSQGSSNAAPPTSRQIATTLKHLMFSRRVWQNVVVYICGAGRTVKVPSVADLNLQSEIGKKVAASEQIVPVMWEMLADYEERSRNSNWIDLTTLLFRIRQNVRTPQPVAVFLDVAISPLALDDDQKQSSTKQKDLSPSEKLIRATVKAAENGRDDLVKILPASLLSQLEIVFCRRDAFNAQFTSSASNSSTPSSNNISRFHQLFAASCANARLDAQLSSLNSAGNSILSGAASSFRLDYPNVSAAESAYYCGELTPLSVVSFIKEHLPKREKSNDDDGNDKMNNNIHHISSLVNSVQLFVNPVYGPRCGVRPDVILNGDAQEETTSRTEQLWKLIYKNVSTVNDEANNPSFTTPICVRGFATSTTLRNLIWNESCLRYFPDSVVYVDVASSAPRRPAYRSFQTAFDQMWKSALQVVCNSFVSFNRTWDTVESATECLKAALLATDFSVNSTSEASNDAILLVFDNIPFASELNSMIHPALIEMVKSLNSRLNVQIVVGFSQSSPVATGKNALINEQDGHVNWMCNTAPLTEKDIKSFNEKQKKVLPSSTIKSVILSETEVSTELTFGSDVSSSSSNAWKKSVASSFSVVDQLEASHKHLLLLIHWMQSENNNSSVPIPLECVAHYAKIHCFRSITDVVRACGVTLLSQLGFIRRVTLMQPRGCETECVFVNPAIRRDLAKIIEDEKMYFTSSSTNATDEEDKPASAKGQSQTNNNNDAELQIPNKYNNDAPLAPLRLPNPKIPLEGHVWRVHTCFAVVPELRDPRLMSLASGMTLFNEIVRPYFPKFLISLAYYAAASQDEIRRCVSEGESGNNKDIESLSLAPKHCYILLREFLMSPMVIGDMISTMGVAATADTIESCSAITAGKISTSAPLFGAPADAQHIAEKKLITALRSIPDLLDNQPFEWTFQLCHRDIRGYYNSLQDKKLFDRVFLPRRTENMTDDEKFDAKSYSGVIIPTLTRITPVQRQKKAAAKKNITNTDDKWNNIEDSSDDDNNNNNKKTKNKKKKQEKQTSSDEDENEDGEIRVSYSDALDFSHFTQDAKPTFVFPETKKYPTCIEYSPLNVSATDPVRGNVVVGFSDGSISVYKMFRDIEQSIATTNHVLPFDMDNALFEVDADDAHSGSPVTNVLFDVERIEETHGEAKIVKTKTKIISASRKTGKILKWKHDLTGKEQLERLTHGDRNISKCMTPLQPILVRHSVDPARIALDRIGIPSSEDDQANNNNNNNNRTSGGGPADHRQNTIASLESGGEIVLLTCGQEQDGERNGAMISLTEVRQCVTSMTFDTKSYSRQSMPEKGIITTASCGVDPFTRAIVVAVGDRSGRIMQFELRVAHLDSADEILEKDLPPAERKKKMEERARAQAEMRAAIEAEKNKAVPKLSGQGNDDDDDDDKKTKAEELDYDDEEEAEEEDEDIINEDNNDKESKKDK